MDIIKLFDSEYKMMKLIWEHQPVNSTELKNLCEVEYQWKKSTTYTIIKKLREKEYIKNENATISALVSIDEVSHSEADSLLERYFDGSVPSFISSFVKNKKLSKKEINEILELIEGVNEDEDINR